MGYTNRRFWYFYLVLECMSHLFTPLLPPSDFLEKRPDVPENIKTSNNASYIDTVPWGIPTASYPADGCNISQYFTPQNLILLTTLCGNW